MLVTKMCLVPFAWIPGMARDHAFAHLLLSRLGYPDPSIDQLLSESLAIGANFGPARLPHHQLEQEWLAHIWSVGEAPARRDLQLVATSMLGRPLDALGCGRLDIYEFTHAVMYASDFGARRMIVDSNSAQRYRRRALLPTDQRC